jgi:thymidylate synthase (FAD)
MRVYTAKESGRRMAQKTSGTVTCDRILDHGYLTLQDWMGSDQTIVKKARQSHDKEDEPVEPDDLKLIHSLMKKRHGTPFEMVVFTFNIKCPILVMREWRTHRIGSFNEMSARYTELKPEFYVPKPKNVRKQVDKQIKYKFEPVDENIAYNARTLIMQANEYAWASYQGMLDMGVAKEVARMALPVNIYTKFSWCVNLRSLFNFISQRSHATAMWEIRQYSKAIEDMLPLIVPVAYTAFVNNGRVAP